MPLELEDGDLPLNTFSPKKPFKGKVISVETLTGPKATGETCNIVIETRGEIPYWEGQSYGVIPPVCRRRTPASGVGWWNYAECLLQADVVQAVDSALCFQQCGHLGCTTEALCCAVQGTKVNSRGKEMPHGTRLYSIAASRYGDKFDGKTTTLCVRRATYWDPEKVIFWGNSMLRVGAGLEWQ